MGVIYDIIESDFNKKLSTAYQLSILVGADSLVYFAFDAGNEQALLLRSFNFQKDDSFQLKNALNEVLAREELFGYLYRRVKIVLPVFDSALVPERLYNEAEKATYLSELGSGIRSAASVQTDEISEMLTRVVYPSAPELTNVIKKHFPTGKFYAAATPLLVGFRKLMAEEKGHVVFVHFHKQVLQIALFHRQNLLFHNTFNYASAGDVLYYLLLTISQFSLDPAVVPVMLSGQVLENSEIYKMLYRYIAHLGFLPAPPFLKFSRKFLDAPPHLFFDLYSLALCK